MAKKDEQVGEILKKTPKTKEKAVEKEVQEPTEEELLQLHQQEITMLRDIGHYRRAKLIAHKQRTDAILTLAHAVSLLSGDPEEAPIEENDESDAKTDEE